MPQKPLKISLLLAALLGLVTIASADPYHFEAAGFSETESGEVPYYFHKAKDAWAINAANEDYRGKFARASLTFTGESGTYDLTLHTLRETDGECSYRVFVGDRFIGVVINGETEVDYAPQAHVFRDVEVDAGDKISIESNAVTNGKIPEGDGTAFARGRWTALEVARSK